MPSLTDIEGIGPSLAAACVKSNYRSIAKIAGATPGELAVVPGISEKGAKPIIDSAKLLMNQTLLRKTAVIKKRGAVAPVKVGGKAIAVKQKAAKNAKKKSPVRKNQSESAREERKVSESKDKKRIKELKKKIKKLKKEKKKIQTKDKKKDKKKAKKK